MPRTGDLPYGQWMPDVEQYVLPRFPGRPQDQKEGPDADSLDDDKDPLDRQHGLANAVRQQKQHLRDRGINGWRIIIAIDVRVDGVVPQPREIGIGWNVAVRVDPGGLDAPVPDVPVDVVRQKDRRTERKQAQEDRRSQDQRQRGPPVSAARYSSGGRRPGNTLQDCDDDEGGKITVELSRKPGGFGRQQQARAQWQ